MRYRTELTDQIIKSKHAAEILNMVAPVYGDDYVSLWLYEVIGRQLDKVDGWIEDFINQLAPQTATWGLVLWESEYGLPVNPPGLSLEQRRQIVINKMWSNGPMNPAKIEQILSALIGYKVEMKERTGKRKFSMFITSRPHLVDEDVFRKRLNEIKPSELIYDITYQNAVSTDIYIGGVIQKSKTINLREV